MTHEETPEILYKYRDLDSFDRITNLLLKGELFFSSAKTFNDPFDTAITYDFSSVEKPIAEEWMNIATDRHMPTESREVKNHYIRNRLIEIRTPGYAERFKEGLIENQYNKFGVCSLASTKENILMWAHYASMHSGICVGLSVPNLEEFMDQMAKKRILIDLMTIRYSETLPKVDFFRAMIEMDTPSDFYELVGVKSSHWSYEQEYRLVYSEKTNIPVEFGPRAIAQLVFGCRIDPKNKEQILKLCRTHLSHIQLFQAQKNLNNFSLDLIPI